MTQDKFEFPCVGGRITMIPQFIIVKNQAKGENMINLQTVNSRELVRQ